VYNFSDDKKLVQATIIFRNIMKNLIKSFAVLLLVGVSYYVWYVHINYRFETIVPDKVYSSALIKPEKLEGFLTDNKIKTVIDLLDPTLHDALNPGKQVEIDAEQKAIDAINEKFKLNIKHVNIPSGQIPSKKTLTKFFEVLDDPSNYPVLIHCYHGTGRAVLYSALYRIEYAGYSNSEARAKTRFIVDALGYKSSFADGKDKGDFLIHYKTRKNGEMSTINQIKN